MIVDEIAFSSYTLPQLEKMASHGSLFVAHLLMEAVVLYDPEGLIARIREFYRPISYEHVLHDVTWSVRLLTNSPDLYVQRPERYHRLVLNLARTYVYATARRDGHQTFSMDALWSHYGGVWGAPLPRLEQLNWSRYLEIRSWIEARTSAVALNPFGSTEALIVNAWGQSRLCVALGLRLLYDGDVLPPYEETDLWSDAW